MRKSKISPWCDGERGFQDDGCASVLKSSKSRAQEATELSEGDGPDAAGHTYLETWTEKLTWLSLEHRS